MLLDVIHKRYEGRKYCEMRAVQRIWLDRYSWGSSTKVIFISVSNGPHLIWHANRSSSCNAARAQVASIENLIDRYTRLQPTVSSRSRQCPSGLSDGREATYLALYQDAHLSFDGGPSIYIRPNAVSLVDTGNEKSKIARRQS
jgi:hypothetical protein